MAALVVRFANNEEDGSYDFLCPDGAELHVSADDVGRSRPLRDMLESAVTCEEATITFPSAAELSHFLTWAAAVQPGSTFFKEGPEDLEKCLEVCQLFSVHDVRWKVVGTVSVASLQRNKECKCKHCPQCCPPRKH